MGGDDELDLGVGIVATLTDPFLLIVRIKKFSAEPDSFPADDWPVIPDSFSEEATTKDTMADSLQLRRHRGTSGKADIGHAHMLFDNLPQQDLVYSLPHMTFALVDSFSLNTIRSFL